MAQHTDEHQLVKLGDSDFRLQAPEHDIRGLDVYDDEGNEIGSVEDLYVDEQERKVRFMDVGAGGFLGIGEKHFMIPVEALREVNEDRVMVDQSREKVAGSPPFDPDVVPRPSYQREVYDYYGYADPHRGPYPGGA